MQWSSQYNHILDHVPPASLNEQFLRLLSVHKAYSDIGKGAALSWQLYLALFFPMQWLSHTVIKFSGVKLRRPSRKRIFNIEHE